MNGAGVVNGRLATGAQRARMNALYKALCAACPDIPRHVVKGFAPAAVLGGDRVHACARAHFGLSVSELGAGGAACARAWAERLSAAAGDTTPGGAPSSACGLPTRGAR